MDASGKTRADSAGSSDVCRTSCQNTALRVPGFRDPWLKGVGSRDDKHNSN